jgi:hypothetical protein
MNVDLEWTADEMFVVVDYTLMCPSLQRSLSANSTLTQEHLFPAKHNQNDVFRFRFELNDKKIHILSNFY